MNDIEPDDPVDRVTRLVAAAGIAGRRIRGIVGLLTEGPQTLASLVQQSAVDRRTVEQVLSALQGDLVDAPAGTVRIAPSRVEEYRDRIGPGYVGQQAQPYGQLLEGHADRLHALVEHIAAAPAPLPSLDHVPATAETVMRRAVWLDRTYDLTGARVLCIGDHDQTSVALALANSTVEIAVVDVDDGVLRHIDSTGAARCLWADLRFRLPDSVRGWADLVVTDPPYTPDGVRLFLARGLQGLRNRDQGRLVMAYGFGEQPALGLKVQQSIASLHLVYEAILPSFNRYHGAQALGSASDLYVLRPTTRSFRTADALTSTVNIYTHGGQSLEGDADALPADLAEPLLAAARGAAEEPVATLVGPGRDAVALSAVLGAEPSAPGRPALEPSVAVDLRADPGSWLVRVLLAVTAQRVAILVPNNHPDLVDGAAQRRLVELVGAKYRLRLRRSTPGPRHAIVEAQRVQPTDVAALATRAVLDRSSGKVANIWREALIASSGGALTKNEARALIRATTLDPSTVDAKLIDLPRHRLQALAEAVAATAASGQS
jgi:predicted methyltransferase